MSEIQLFPRMPHLKFSQVGGGGSEIQLFPRMPNLKFSQVGGGGGGFGPNFFQGCQISGQKFFPLASAQVGGGGFRTQLFSRMPNFRSKIFPFTKRSGLCIFSGGGGGGFGPNFFQGRQISGQKCFPSPSTLDSVFLRWWDAVMQNLGSEEIGSFGSYSLTRGGQCLVYRCVVSKKTLHCIWPYTDVCNK